MPTSVTPAFLLSGLLASVVSRVPNLADPTVATALLTLGIAQAVADVQKELGTRMDVTHFVPYLGAAAPPALDQTNGPAEYAGYQQWPGAIPGDGIPSFRPRCRPLVGINSCTLYFPGALITTFAIPLSWFRVDRQTSEIVVAPTGGDAVYALAYASGGMGWRTPQTMALDYTAGLGPDGMLQWPQVDHLISLRAVIKVLPTISSMFNPTGLSSISADGLTQSRSSGYVFKDLEERLKTEADELKRSILDLWDGPSFVML